MEGDSRSPRPNQVMLAGLDLPISTGQRELLSQRSLHTVEALLAIGTSHRAGLASYLAMEDAEFAALIVQLEKRSAEGKRASHGLRLPTKVKKYSLGAAPPESVAADVSEGDSV